nr:hypothetical protein [Candidatus Sigynarchaeum springense]
MLNTLRVAIGRETRDDYGNVMTPMVGDVDGPDLNNMMDFEPATLIERLPDHGYKEILDDLGIASQFHSKKRSAKDVKHVIARLKPLVSTFPSDEDPQAGFDFDCPKASLQEFIKFLEKIATRCERTMEQAWFCFLI